MPRVQPINVRRHVLRLYSLSAARVSVLIKRFWHPWPCSRSGAFASIASLRMMAVMATFGGFTAAIKGLLSGLHIGVEADRDQAWHVEGLAEVSASRAGETLADVLA